MIVLNHQDQGHHGLWQGSWSWIWDVSFTPHHSCLSTDALYLFVPTSKEKAIISSGLGILYLGSEFVMAFLILQDNSGSISHAVSTCSARLLWFYQMSSLFVLADFTSCTYFCELLLSTCHFLIVVFNGDKMLWVLQNTDTLSPVTSLLCAYIHSSQM